jgi:hypothetical protein
MNHVFAALAVAAFGMVVLGGDASAAPAATQAKPAHKQSASKPAAVKAPSKKAAPKAAAARAPVAKAAPAKAQADKRADKRSTARAEKVASATGRGGKERVEKEVVGKKATTQAAARPERLSKAEPGRQPAKSALRPGARKTGWPARSRRPVSRRAVRVAARAEREQPSAARGARPPRR